VVGDWFLSLKSPMPVENKKLCEQFIKRLAKEVRARDLLPGLDKESFDLTQLFELGMHWRKLPEAKPISKDRLAMIGDFGVIAYSDRAGRSFGPWADILGHEYCPILLHGCGRTVGNYPTQNEI
jgi:hypothetical protein